MAISRADQLPSQVGTPLLQKHIGFPYYLSHYFGEIQDILELNHF